MAVFFEVSNSSLIIYRKLFVGYSNMQKSWDYASSKNLYDRAFENRDETHKPAKVKNGNIIPL